MIMIFNLFLKNQIIKKKILTKKLIYSWIYNEEMKKWLKSKKLFVPVLKVNHIRKKIVCKFMKENFQTKEIYIFLKEDDVLYLSIKSSLKFILHLKEKILFISDQTQLEISLSLKPLQVIHWCKLSHYFVKKYLNLVNIL